MTFNFPIRPLLGLGLLGLAGQEIALARTAEPVEKISLFTAGASDYAAYRIPAIVVTPQKTVLVAVEARKNNRADWGLIDLFIRRSTDHGQTWEPARMLVGQTDLPADLTRNPVAPKTAASDGEFTVNNPTWVTDTKQGKTFFLFCAEYMRCFMMESPDGGTTFSRPREITNAFEDFRTRDRYHWQVIAVGPGHGVQLNNGRLVVPVWLSTSKGGPHRPSVCATIYSDDGGATWQAGAIAAGRDDGVLDPSETAVVEVEPGKVMLNIRSASPVNRRAIVWSKDGASGWTVPEFNQDLWEPVCMASLARLADGTLVFSNPASLDPNPKSPRSTGKQRRNVGVRTSRNHGKTWSAPFVLDSGPSAYSDLAVASDGTILCFYEHGSKTPYEAMTLARIPVSALPAPQP